MKHEFVFLTTSHNQFSQVRDLYSQLREKIDREFSMVCVESASGGDYSWLPSCGFHLLKTHHESFWAESNALGLDFVFSNFGDSHFHLIMINCDVRLSDWKILCGLETGLYTFYTVSAGHIGRSGYSFANRFIASHRHSRLGQKYDSRMSVDSVDIVPTRLVFISACKLNRIQKIRPRYKRLPHYGSDYVFTFEVGRLLGELWVILPWACILEDVSTTGSKSSNGSLLVRSRLFFDKRSVFRLRDRFWYAYYVSDGNPFYIVASLFKLVVQVYAKTSR